MSIIFKEKHYDFIVILFKKISLILLFFLIIASTFNIYINYDNNDLKAEFNSLKSEELKLKKLIKNSNKKNEDKLNTINFDLMTKIAASAEKVRFELISKENSVIYLNAVTNSQSSIFKLIEKLKADSLFADVKLLNLKENNNFQLKILLSN